MSWLFIILLMVTDAEATTAAESTAPEERNDRAKQDHSNRPQPDKELLLFLAEWDETVDGEWIEPSTFAEDSTLNQQMDQQNHNETKMTHENKPDYN